MVVIHSIALLSECGLVHYDEYMVVIHYYAL